MITFFATLLAMTLRFLCKKLSILLVSFFLIVTLTFILMKSIPGDPFMDEQAIPEEIMLSMRKHYGLDLPLHTQFLRYLKGIVTWDFGPSFKYEGRLVTEIISDGFPVSFTLGVEAVTLAVFGGISLGTLAALKRGKALDHLAMLVAVVGISVPSFILGSLLQYLFGMKLGWLPIARWGTFSQTVLPAIALASIPMAFIARLTRTNVIEVLEQDYILTAKAKGLSTLQIVLKHVLRNSLLPVVAYLGSFTAAILTGSFIIEKIFGIPGLGGWFVVSITNRDYTVIMGLTVFYSAILLMSIFGVDIICALLDPRIRNKEVAA